MTNILYVHGFGSYFDPNSDKILELQKAGNVFGVNVDYTKGYDHVINKVIDSIIDNDIDNIVGTSMGGYTAAIAGTKTGIPYVSLNPAIKPSEQLLKYLGNGMNYDGTKFHLSTRAIDSYPDMIDLVENGFGQIIVAMDDDVINPSETINTFKDYHSMYVNTGGHRFENMDIVIDTIKRLMDGNIVNGIQN